MMFNGLMCGDSDTSDFTKESAGGRAGTSSSACSEAARAPATYYRNKLLSTTQILQNSEETVRVQSESLGVAEARIAALTARCALLRKELDQRTKELQTLKSLKTEKITACSSAHTQEVDNQNIVCTLQNNLSVIEELYRECFYEAAKQESLIEMLRQSCMEVRASARGQRDHIGALQDLVFTQRCSLDRCQDIALEVDSLKTEISNFLNSSNNDSGMWEESSGLGGVGTAVGEELQDILHQLLRLRDMLTSDCTCGLEEENEKLKQTNKNMETQIDDLQQKICDLETTLHNNSSLDQKSKENVEDKEKELETLRNLLKTQKIDVCPSAVSTVFQTECTCDLREENKKLKQTNKTMETQISDQREKISDLEMLLRNQRSLDDVYQEEIATKEKQLLNIRTKLSALEEENRSRTCESCDSLTLQLQQTQVDLKDKELELCRVQAQSDAQQRAFSQLQAEFDQAAVLIEKNDTIRNEMDLLRTQATCCRKELADTEQRAAALEAELVQARQHIEQVDTCYSEKAANAAELRQQLEQAHARGAALCAEARRVVAAVRRWAARVRARHSEQEQNLKEKEILLTALQRRLEARQHDTEHTSTSELDNEPTCSKCTATRSARTSVSTYSQCARQREQFGTSASEVASCSSAPPPVPPKRSLRKKLCQEKRCQCRGFRTPGVQQAPRRDAVTEPALQHSATQCYHDFQMQHVSVHRIPSREVSPSEELFTRVEHLGAALAHSYRRWTRHSPQYNNNNNDDNNR